MKKIKIKELKHLYENFFEKIGGKYENGILKEINHPRTGKKLRFSTYPYIGSKYWEGKRILFLGLDIGKDEPINFKNVKKDQASPIYGIQSFKERRIDIEDKNIAKHNAHIRGTYVIASYFLDLYRLEDVYENETYKNWMERIKFIENPLSFVALVNIHKFVTENRKNRFGGSDRIFLKEEEEINLLFDEIKIFNPSVIIVQSAEVRNAKKYIKILEKLRTLKNSKFYIGNHPSSRIGQKVLKLNRSVLDN